MPYAILGLPILSIYKKMLNIDKLLFVYCEECGMGARYADDLQFTISGKKDEELIRVCNRV